MNTKFAVYFRHFILLSLLALINIIVFESTANAQHTDDDFAENIQQIKKRGVIFVLPEDEYEYMDDYQQLLSNAWTLSPIKVIKYSDLSSYPRENGKYCYFTIGVSKFMTVRDAGGSYSSIHYYLTLSVPYARSSSLETQPDELYRIELYPEMRAVLRPSTKDITHALYTRTILRNFKLPYMLAYVKFVQQNLLQGKKVSVTDFYRDKILLEKLKNDTLYILKNTLFSRNKFNGKESEIEEEFFKSYPGKYKYVSTDELIDLIKSRGDSNPLYLFEYVQSGTDKHVSVLDVSSGTMVYRRYTPISYNIKDKDLRAILE